MSRETDGNGGLRRLPGASTVWIGLCWGLCAPLLVTLDGDRLWSTAPIAAPCGALASICLHLGLAAALRSRGLTAGEAAVAARRAFAPGWLVGFAPLALLVGSATLPALVAFVAAGLCLARLVLLARRFAFASRPRTLVRLIFLATFVILWVALFQVHIVHDAFQYYGYLPSLLLDGDLDLYDELYLHNAHRFYNPFPVGSARYVGTAVMEAPFFLIGHGTAGLLGALGRFYAPNGYSLPYRFFVSLASGVFGLAGLVASYRLTRTWFPSTTALVATLAVWLASPLVFFMYCWGGWAHPFAFFFAAAFLVVWQRTRSARRLRDWAVLGTLAGFLCLVRPAGGVVLFFPLVEWLGRLRSAGLSGLSGATAGPALGAFVALVVFSPQLALWKITSGSWISAPYRQVGDHHDWLRPDLFGILFSPARHGLLVWTPLLLPCAVGLVVLWRRDRLVAAGSLLAVATTTYLYASWSIWWSGIGFSNRFFLELTPLFVLGLAAGVHRLGRSLRRDGILAILLLAVAWNLVLVADYRSNILRQGIPDPARVVDDSTSLGSLVASNLRLEARIDAPPFWLPWLDDGFVTERVRGFLVHGSPRGVAGVGFATAIATLLATGVLRVAFGRSSGLAAPAPVVGAGLLVTLAAHAVIGSAAGSTGEPGGFYHFEESRQVARHPGEDVELIADYPRPVTALDLVTFLTYGHRVRQGSPVAAVTVYGDGGHQVTELLRAGIDTAETSFLRAEFRDAILHGIEETEVVRDAPTRVYSDRAYDLLTFRAAVELPAPMVVRSVRIRYLQPTGRLVVADAFLRES